MAFPKIIHQIWLQGQDNIPDKFFSNIGTIKKFHASWQYMLWDDISIIKLLRKNKIWIDTYYKFNYLHQKVDYAKYIILYEHGGAYIDIDVLVLKSLDTLIGEYSDYDLLVSKVNLNKFESMLYCRKPVCVNNGTIIAKYHNPTMAKLIDHINNHPQYYMLTSKFTTINNTTGPIVFTKIILDELVNSKIKILDSEFLEPKLLGIGDITHNTYMVHEHEGSWLNSSFRKMAQFYFKHKPIIFVLFIIIIIIVMTIIILSLCRKNNTTIIPPNQSL